MDFTNTRKKDRTGIALKLSVVLVMAASLLPSEAAAQTFRSSSVLSLARLQQTPSRPTATASRAPLVTIRSLTLPSFRRMTFPLASAPVTSIQDPRPAPAADARITIDLHGTYSSLASGDVTVRRDGAVIARGGVSDTLVVAGGSPVDVSVTVTSLVDRPTVELRGVALPSQGGAVTVPMSVETGLIRATATIAGRTVSGVVRLYRIDEATGVVSSTSCGSFGANTSSREISAGRYRAVLVSGSATLTRDVVITAGSSRLVRLEG